MDVIYFGKKFFHNNPLYFRIYSDFGTDYEIDNPSTGKEQLTFSNKIQYVVVIIYYLNWMVFWEVIFMNLI